MKRLVVCAALIAMLAPLAPARAQHSWSGYHWARTANPFTLKVVDSVNGRWEGLLDEVTQAWSESDVLDTVIVAGQSDPLTQVLCNPQIGTARACNFNYGPNFWFGLATVWLDRSHITRGAVQVNDFYFTGSYANDTARAHVLCQELGHVLGLTHHKKTSCMDDTNSTLNLESHRGPNGHDLNMLATIYSHTDASTTVASSSAASAPTTTFVRTEGTETVITYVFWVR